MLQMTIRADTPPREAKPMLHHIKGRLSLDPFLRIYTLPTNSRPLSPVSNMAILAGIIHRNGLGWC